MKLKLNISSCPNDTFMFDALIHHKIDTRGHTFETGMADIEQLNEQILEGGPDISKISCAVYPLITDRYKISRSGSALGRGNGPLLISRYKIYPDEVSSVTVAVPGLHTTANLLLEHAFGPVRRKKAYLFSDIAEAVSDGEADAGVLIHEQRFTYKKRNLRLISDLGALWEESTSKAIPLGAIAISRSLEDSVQKEISELIGESIRFAFNHPSSGYDFIRSHAQELDDRIIGRHIAMFVNDYSLDLGEEGMEAVEELLKGQTEINRTTTFI